MSAIWNVNSRYYNDNNKKISTKLSFTVGERVAGKVTKQGDGKEATVKLADGWEFTAEVEGDLQGLEQGIHKFEVVGGSDGKLRLKVIKSDAELKESKTGDLNQIISSEGLVEDDELLLKEMLKHNISLTKENIKQVKSLLDLSVRVNNNPNEIDAFIEKYLQGKGIEGRDLKGQEIKELLKDFFKSFKGMSKADILLFIENNMDFTQGTIDSYNKIFKGNLNPGDILKALDTAVKKLDITFNNNLSKGISEGNIDLNNTNVDKLPKEVAHRKDEFLSNKVANSYGNNINKGEKIDILGLLKSLAGNSEEVIKSAIKDIINTRKDTVSVNEFKGFLAAIDNIDDNEFVKIVKYMDGDSRDSSTGSDTTFKYNEVDLIDNYNQKDKIGNLNEAKEKYTIVNGKENNTIFSSVKKETVESALTLVIGKRVDLTDLEFTKLKNLIILTDQLSNGEEIHSDKLNTGNLVNEGIQLDSVSKEMNNIYNSKENNHKLADSIINEIKREGLDSLINDKLIKNISTREIDEGMSKKLLDIAMKNIADITNEPITTQDFVKESINKNINESKDIIKDLLSIIKSGGQDSEKVIGVIKNSISDITTLNKISQEYYYMDSPVRIKGNDYPCKLIVKDDRKSGKKLDSSNIKIVVTVKTLNLGTVDGYLKVKDKNIDIELKSEEKFINAIVIGKEKLIDNIAKLGFNINVKVSKREDEATLTNCRDFFKDNNRLGIDYKV